MKKLVHVILVLILVSCYPTNDSLELSRWESNVANVEIIRDDFGVPHVYGKTDANTVFGLLYAQCEDDFRRVERNFTWAIGRLAETEGGSALYSDLRARLFMTEEEAKEQYATTPDWLKDLCVAWADGINFYLKTHPEVEPKVIKKYEPWMTMYFTEGSIGGDIERVSLEEIQAFYEGKELVYEGKESGYLLEEPQGSNGFAISGDLTASGYAMLLINPHTSFYFRGEVHAVSEEGLNAYGAVTWGQFFVYQGFNENTGWMHTSTYTDVIDEFQETIIEKDDELFYKYGDEERPVEVKEVTLKYLQDGELEEKTFPIYRTHHGPVTHETDGKWTATALMWEPVKALEQSYTRTKKRNLGEFSEMMNIRTNSSNNTVFADSEGNIAYYHGNFIPIRDQQFDYTQPVDGSDPATDWQGLHKVEEAIKVINPANGWIQNCNSTPFTSAAEFSPKREDYPNYMSRAPENFRGVNAIRLLSVAKDLSLQGLIDLAYDPYLPAFEKVIPGLIEAYDKSEYDKTMWDAMQLLKNWDFNTGVDSKAMSLAHFYGMSLYRHAESPDSLSGIERFQWFGTGLEDIEKLRIFKLAMEEMNERYGSWLIPWGKVNRFQRISGNIDASFDDAAPSIPVGYTTALWGHLAAYGMRGEHDVDKIYGTRGNSFVAAVEFGEKVKAKTILAGGQSSDPNSPHFDDQALMYANGKFKEAAFYREDVEARAEGKVPTGTAFQCKPKLSRNMRKIFTFATTVFLAVCLQAQSPIGAWEWFETDSTGRDIRAVVIFSKEHQVATWYDAESGAFIATNGGGWDLNGSTMTEVPEFDTRNDGQNVGKQISFDIAWDGKDKMRIPDYDVGLTRIDDGTPDELEGAWLISGRMRNGEIQERDTNRPRKTMKILSGTRFQWIAYNTETKKFMGTGGGTYTTADGKYTENIEFFSRDDSRVGASLEFNYELKDGKWHHSGKSSKGDPIYEVWSQRQK